MLVHPTGIYLYIYNAVTGDVIVKYRDGISIVYASHISNSHSCMNMNVIIYENISDRN